MNEVIDVMNEVMNEVIDNKLELVGEMLDSEDPQARDADGYTAVDHLYYAVRVLAQQVPNLRDSIVRIEEKLEHG